MWKQASLVTVVILLGLLLGRAVAQYWGGESVGWSARGSGPTLIEYFDPECGQSRRFHRNLSKVIANGIQVRHVLVPVALARAPGEVTTADRLCVAGPEQTWVLAASLAHDPSAASAPTEIDDELLADCQRRVAEATFHLADLHPDGVQAAPMVEFQGRIYVGNGSFAALERALEALK